LPIGKAYKNSFSLTGNEQQPSAAAVQTSLGLLGGDASGLSGLPGWGPDIWHEGIIDPQVYATWWWSQGTNGGAVQVTNIINTWNANGMLFALTNRGLSPWIQLDAAWMQPNRINGDIVVNSNLYPSGLVALRQYVNSTGFKLEGGIYYVGLVTNEFSSGISGFQANTDDPSVMHVAASTPLTVSHDITTFYPYFDSIRVADYQPADGSQALAGYSLQSMRQWSFYAKYPGGAFYKLYGYTNRIGLSWFIGGTPNFHPDTAANINVLNCDHVSSGAVGTAVSSAVDALRQNHTNSSWAIGPGHFMSIFCANVHQAPDLISWRSMLTAGALHSMLIQTDDNSDQAYYNEITNSVLLDVYFDSAYHPAWRHFDDGRNSAWIKPLTVGRYAVAWFNESTTNHQVTLPWNAFIAPRNWRPIQPPPMFTALNSWMAATNVWSGSEMGVFNNADYPFNSTIGPGNLLFVVFTPVSN
jgi:hypothetical protein